MNAPLELNVALQEAVSDEPKGLADLAEIDRFQEAVSAHLAGDIDEERFTAMRLQQGVYGQRQAGVNMLRVKVPGGGLRAEQLNAVADVVETYSQHGTAHITTRQSIQIHYVPLADTPAAMRKLAQAGLTTREACGNTVRNMSACTLAGICPREHTDVNTHLKGAALHFIRNPLNQQLPRKFKISFSGCETDCAQGMLHDLGVVAVKEGSGKKVRFGFKLLAGGGLGHKPHEAIVIDPFVEERDLLLAMEAVIALHNKYSDRTKRAKSRIKFLVDKFGPEGFIEKYREEFARTKEALGERPYPQGEWEAGSSSAEPPGQGAPRRLQQQKQTTLYTMTLAVPLGDVNAKQLRGVARLMQQHELAEVRTTQDQNLLLVNVPRHKIVGLRSGFAGLGLHEPEIGDNVVACPGTTTCRLGITSSPIVAPKLASDVGGDLRIRVSGCHNGCAQPETGDIGIYGEGRRLHGKLIPHYQMFFGGSGMAGGGYALKGPSVPAARVQSAIKRVRLAYAASKFPTESFFDWARRREVAFFSELLADLIEVKADDLGSVLRDHGDETDFKVLQLGGGECAGASMVHIGSAFFEAAHEREYRNALYFQRKYSESAACAENIVRTIAGGLYSVVVGLGRGQQPPAELPALSAALAEKLPAELVAALQGFAETFGVETEWEEPATKALAAEIDRWTLAAAEFALTQDRTLDLSGALPKGTGPQIKAQPVTVHRPAAVPA